ncbi:MAG: hypothetical protein N3A69_06870 [Leptospiraceae bacterium]|nr:hypothetical protein [Leptospiraceae bacterium]
MEFTLKNIGLINHAKIELKGLTVLGGYNDTGKSFIGKTLFSIIKAANNTERVFVFSKLNNTERVFVFSKLKKS